MQPSALEGGTCLGSQASLAWVSARLAALEAEAAHVRASALEDRRAAKAAESAAASSRERERELELQVAAERREAEGQRAAEAERSAAASEGSQRTAEQLAALREQLERERDARLAVERDAEEGARAREAELERLEAGMAQQVLLKQRLALAAREAAAAQLRRLRRDWWLRRLAHAIGCWRAAVQAGETLALRGRLAAAERAAQSQLVLQAEALRLKLAAAFDAPPLESDAARGAVPESET